MDEVISFKQQLDSDEWKYCTYPVGIGVYYWMPGLSGRMLVWQWRTANSYIYTVSYIVTYYSCNALSNAKVTSERTQIPSKSLIQRTWHVPYCFGRKNQGREIEMDRPVIRKGEFLKVVDAYKALLRPILQTWGRQLTFCYSSGFSWERAFNFSVLHNQMGPLISVYGTITRDFYFQCTAIRGDR